MPLVELYEVSVMYHISDFELYNGETLLKTSEFYKQLKNEDCVTFKGFKCWIADRVILTVVVIR